MKTFDLIQAFQEANRATIENANALIQTHALRRLIKACEERITDLSDDATAEAFSALGAAGKTQGEFTILEPDGTPRTFQIQRTDIYDMTNYSRYKDEDAKRWRIKNAQRQLSRNYASALSKEMDGIVKAFAASHPDWTPDETRVTIKCIMPKEAE